MLELAKIEDVMYFYVNENRTECLVFQTLKQASLQVLNERDIKLAPGSNPVENALNVLRKENLGYEILNISAVLEDIALKEDSEYRKNLCHFYRSSIDTYYELQKQKQNSGLYGNKKLFRP